ncbi:MAG: FAD-dependent oxidoreductase [Desulfobacterales bacterium]|jgi:2,4-dienoyl-CoA reductase (NADPH2)|nr:FAD-dependent oxidoreductase [Desulfobacteraceae bacterium]MBT7084858.1 FAD-dependent oxidoreductase [Desulfobacterales bacterium]MBT7698257.1 FAD-dependent oxidoreductase [Desulfobacterales bacterium]
MYENLFSPITINKCEIRNRTAYPAIGLLYSDDSLLNDRYNNFWETIAKGGVGILTVGPLGVDFLGSGNTGLTLRRDDVIPSYQKLNRLIHDAGAKSWVQLMHVGGYAHPFMIDGQQPIAPSSIYSSYSHTTPREMTIDEIKEVQKSFVEAAVRAKKSDFDGVELIGSAGYLLTQFLSPLKNNRTDEYGGSFENRTRFPREIIEMVREAVGPDYAITIRMAGSDFVVGSNTDHDTPEFAKVYEKAGIDAINVTGGWHESKIPQIPMDLPRSGYAFLAGNIKKAVSIPVMASNRITTPDEAEKIIRDGHADMVNLGRVLIADPEWPNKAKAGHPEEIRPCIACSQGCMDMVMSQKPVFCIANACAGMEGDRKIVQTKSSKKVMVIGAGPGGLEAAIVAKEAGHNVELYEKADDIGGQIWIAAKPPHKSELLEFIRYYRAMLIKYDIPLHLNTEVDVDLIKKINPDHIIIGEGAVPIVPPINGADDPSVMDSWDVLKNDPGLGKNVAVIGGGAVGLETAMFVSLKGTISPDVLHFLFSYDAVSIERLKELVFNGSSNVTVFEMLPKAGQGVGRSTKWILMGNIKKHGITLHTNAKVTSIKDGLITFEKDDKEEQMQFDNVIMAAGSKSVTKLSDEVKNLGIPFDRVGDCVNPEKLDNAIHGGFLAAVKI